MCKFDYDWVNSFKLPLFLYRGTFHVCHKDQNYYSLTFCLQELSLFAELSLAREMELFPMQDLVALAMNLIYSTAHTVFRSSAPTVKTLE